MSPVDPDEHHALRGLLRIAGIDPKRLVRASREQAPYAGMVGVSFDLNPPMTPDEEKRFKAAARQVSAMLGGKPPIFSRGDA